MYGLPDFCAFRSHKGKKAILWAGSDLRYFADGYWIDDKGKQRVNPHDFAKYLKKFDNWVENTVEADLLKKFGIKAKVCPSFLGKTNSFNVSFKQGNKVYASVSGDDFNLYKWDLIEEIAGKVPDVNFYLYGNKKGWKTKHKNVIIRGRLSQKDMDNEIKNMQCGLRLLGFDGASEVVVKSVLWGQHAISKIAYPFVDNYKTKEDLINILKLLPLKQKPNLRARKWFIKNLNHYTWNKYAIRSI